MLPEEEQAAASAERRVHAVLRASKVAMRWATSNENMYASLSWEERLRRASEAHSLDAFRARFHLFAGPLLDGLDLTNLVPCTAAPLAATTRPAPPPPPPPLTPPPPPPPLPPPPPPPPRSPSFTTSFQVVAGGSVLHALMLEGDPADPEVQLAARKGPADIDFFVVADDDASAHAAFDRLFTHLRTRLGAATAWSPGLVQAPPDDDGNAGAAGTADARPEGPEASKVSELAIVVVRPVEKGAARVIVGMDQNSRACNSRGSPGSLRSTRSGWAAPAKNISL